MSTPDADTPVVLTIAANEAQAAVLAAALDERGIQTHTTGALTSGFRAEAPGGVRLLVRAADLARAQAALREIEAARAAEPDPSESDSSDQDTDQD